MSRHGYSDDWDDCWATIRYRGAVKAAFRGRRGQAFLREILAAMDALPEQKLIAHDLEKDGAVCAIGAVGRARGVDMSTIDPEDTERVANTFGVAEAQAREIAYMNDEAFWGLAPEVRFQRMRAWIASEIRTED